MGLSELSTLLWRERQALEYLLFKLSAEHLVVANGQVRWLEAANLEVETAATQVHAIEVLRAVEADSVASELALLPGASLAELSDAALEPWSLMLAEHRAALILLIGEIGQACDENRQLLATAARTVRQSLLAVTKPADTYDARGVLVSTASGAVLMDELT